jgi:hypothetical protein
MFVRLESSALFWQFQIILDANDLGLDQFYSENLDFRSFAGIGVHEV